MLTQASLRVFNYFSHIAQLFPSTAGLAIHIETIFLYIFANFFVFSSMVPLFLEFIRLIVVITPMYMKKERNVYLLVLIDSCS